MANYTKLSEDDVRFECPAGCGCDYDNASDAASCCGSYNEAYQCGRCSSSYEDEGDAKDCCPSVSVVYQCCDCGNTYSNEDEARICCTSDADELPHLQWECVVDHCKYATEEEARGCCGPYGEGILVDEDGVPQLWCGECDCYNCTCGCNTCTRARDEFNNQNKEREVVQEFELEHTVAKAESWEDELA